MAVDIEFKSSNLQKQIAEAVAKGFREGLAKADTENKRTMVHRVGSGTINESIGKMARSAMYLNGGRGGVAWSEGQMSSTAEARQLGRWYSRDTKEARSWFNKYTNGKKKGTLLGGTGLTVFMPSMSGKAHVPLKLGGVAKRARNKIMNSPIQAMASQQNQALFNLISQVQNSKYVPQGSSMNVQPPSLFGGTGSTGGNGGTGNAGSGKGKKKFAPVPPYIDELIKQEFRNEGLKLKEGLETGWLNQTDFPHLRGVAREHLASRYSEFQFVKNDADALNNFIQDLKDSINAKTETRFSENPTKFRPERLGISRSSFIAEAKAEKSTLQHLARVLYAQEQEAKNPNAGANLSKHLGFAEKRYDYRLTEFNKSLADTTNGVRDIENIVERMRKATSKASDEIAKRSAKPLKVVPIQPKGKRGYHELAFLERESRYRSIDQLFKLRKLNASQMARAKAFAADTYESRMLAWTKGTDADRSNNRQAMIHNIGRWNDLIQANKPPQLDRVAWHNDPWYKFTGVKAWIKERDPNTGLQRRSILSSATRSFSVGMKRMAAMVETLWLVRYGFINMLAPLTASTKALVESADAYTRLKNTYNVALSPSMTQGRSFDQWYESSFGKARALRMKASTWRDMMMNAAPIFATGRFENDATVNGVQYKKGQQIITSMDQLERVMTNLMRMQRISGSSDYEFQHAMMQIIQMVSKGKGGIQDIKPMLEAGGHMGEIFAQYAFRAHTGDLFTMSEKGQLKGETILSNLLSDDVTKDLEQRHRRTHRTWEEVGNIVGGIADEWLTPLIREASSQSEYGLGDQIVALAERVFNSDAQQQFMSIISTGVDWLYEFGPRIMEQIPRLIATMIRGFAVNTALVGMAKAIYGTIKGLVAVFITVGYVVRMAIDAVALLVDAIMNPIGFIGNKGWDRFGWMDNGWEWVKGSWASTAATFSDIPGSFQTASDLSAMATSIEGSLTDVASMQSAYGKTMASIKKQEDERLPLMATGLSPLSNLDKNVEDIKKSSRQATATQLAILKQVVGTRVINRVTHVAPNVKTNIGTINSGAQIEELLRQLGDGMRHAVTTYTMTGA